LALSRVLATFAKNAYVNDVQREIVGIDAIRRWIQKEITGEHVTVEVCEVADHYGDLIVRGRYEGDYDKTNLPKELGMKDPQRDFSSTPRSGRSRNGRFGWSVRCYPQRSITRSGARVQAEGACSAFARTSRRGLGGRPPRRSTSPVKMSKTPAAKLA
jgi:hypothetical protein